MGNCCVEARIIFQREEKFSFADLIAEEMRQEAENNSTQKVMGEEEQKEHDQKILKILKEADTPVTHFLTALWYFTSEWPSQDHDYNQEIQSLKTRIVGFEDWESEPDIDSEGRKKAFEIPLHRGMFQDFEGVILNLKPRKPCETWTSLTKKSMPELLRLYVTAVEEELEKLFAKLDKLSQKKESEALVREETNDNSHIEDAVLKKWWFCSPEWPPTKHNYEQKLKKEGWRNVSLNDWENEPYLKNGKLKAFEIPLHPQIFQNLFGSRSICRPRRGDDIESYKNLKKKSMCQLFKLYAHTMQKQLDQFKASHLQLLS